MNNLQSTYRENVMTLQDAVSRLPGAMFGDCFPLKHSFADGLYVREIFIPKKNLIISKIHKFSHPCFMLKGDISVLSENGVKRFSQPSFFISPSGAKRVGYAHEDTWWITIHKTEETDLDKIEKDVIVDSFDKLTKEENDFIDILNNEVSV